MDILHLSYFLEVAHQKSFTKASQTLHVSQPTISKVVKTLENELNATLFERSGKEVKLTDAGWAVFQRAQKVVNEFQNLTTELNDVLNLKTGELAIGLPPMVGARFFPTVIGRFRQAYPCIKIKLIEVGSKQIEADVYEGSLDLGVIALPATLEGFEFFSFVNETLRVVMPPDHPLDKHTRLSLSELKDEPFVIYKDDFSLYSQILNQCQAYGFMPEVACQSSQWDFIVEMVGAKLGIALLPETICNELDPQRFKSVTLSDPVIPWNLAIIWNKGRYMSFAARAWLQLAKEYFCLGA